MSENGKTTEEKDICWKLRIDSMEDPVYFVTRDSSIQRGDRLIIQGWKENPVEGIFSNRTEVITYPSPVPEEGIFFVDEVLEKIWRLEISYKVRPGIYGGVEIYGLSDYSPRFRRDIWGREIVVPDTINGKQVVEIGNNVFHGCRGLKKVILPDGLRRISENAFEYCSDLEEVLLPDGVDKIGDNCFRNCTSLSDLKLPQGLTEISNGLISGCSNLKTLYIPDSVHKIPDRFCSRETPDFYCSAFSDAAEYAEKNKINHIKSEYYGRIHTAGRESSGAESETGDKDRHMPEEPAVIEMTVASHAPLAREMGLKRKGDGPDTEPEAGARRTGNGTKAKSGTGRKTEHEAGVKMNYSDSPPALRVQVEVMNGTFSAMGLKVLQVGGLSLQRTASGEEALIFDVELTAEPGERKEFSLELKINVYDKDGALIAMGSHPLDSDKFTGYDTIEVSVTHGGIWRSAASIRVYASNRQDTGAGHGKNG